MAQAGFDRFAFAAILRVNDHFRARFACPFRSFIIRSIIDNEHIIDLVARSTHDIVDMFFLLIRRNDGRDFMSIWRARVGLLHRQRTIG